MKAYRVHLDNGGYVNINALSEYDAQMRVWNMYPGCTITRVEYISDRTWGIPGEQEELKRKEMGEPCECRNWCNDGRPPLLSHHHACTKYAPIPEMLEIITDLVKGIQDWAADEDGVHPACWEAYGRAKICIAQFDHIGKA